MLSRGSTADREGRFVVALVAGASILRLFHLGRQSLWVDEMMTLQVATPKTGYPISNLILHNVHGPLHTFVVYLFRFAGEADAWLRLPSAAAGILSVVVFYRWVREWMDGTTARLAAVLLAVNPMHVYYSQELRNYSFLFLFAVLSCRLLARFIADAGDRGWWRYAIVVAAAALCNFSAAFLFAAQTGVFFLARGVRVLAIRRWALVGAVVLALISPWVYRIVTYVDFGRLATPVMPGEIAVTERLRGETTVTPMALPYTFYAFSAGFSLGPSLRDLHAPSGVQSAIAPHRIVIAMVALVFGTLSILGVLVLRRRRRRAVELALYLLVPIVATFALNWQNAKAFNPRYVFVALPAYLVLVSLGALSLPRRARVLAVAAALGISSISLWNYYFDGRYAREDVRGAMRYIADHQDTPRRVVAPTVVEVARHYARPGVEVRAVYNPGWVGRERVSEQVDAAVAGCNSVWYLRARPWVNDGNGWVADDLMARFRETERVELDGISLIRYEIHK